VVTVVRGVDSKGEWRSRVHGFRLLELEAEDAERKELIRMRKQARRRESLRAQM